jgi:hypothetical protein
VTLTTCFCLVMWIRIQGFVALLPVRVHGIHSGNCLLVALYGHPKDQFIN